MSKTSNTKQQETISRAPDAVEKSPERSGSIRVQHDGTRKPIRINFDWIPAVDQGTVTFNVTLNHTQISFGLYLLRLRRGELKELYAFMTARHAGIDNAIAVLKMTRTLLDWSLRQHEPGASPHERSEQVRTILLEAAFGVELE